MSSLATETLSGTGLSRGPLGSSRTGIDSVAQTAALAAKGNVPASLPSGDLGVLQQKRRATMPTVVYVAPKRLPVVNWGKIWRRS